MIPLAGVGLAGNPNGPRAVRQAGDILPLKHLRLCPAILPGPGALAVAAGAVEAVDRPAVLVGAMRLARDLGPGKTIVTILADGGQRYQSKLFNPEFLRQKNLPLPPWMS